jgi:hypothetical protein
VIGFIAPLTVRDRLLGRKLILCLWSLQYAEVASISLKVRLHSNRLRYSAPYLPEAIVFGDGKPQIGCLILPSELCKGMDQESIFEKAWVGIDMANKAAPSHSRIVPELVEILPCDYDLCG